MFSNCAPGSGVRVPEIILSEKFPGKKNILWPEIPGRKKFQARKKLGGKYFDRKNFPGFFIPEKTGPDYFQHKNFPDCEDHVPVRRSPSQHHQAP